MCSQLITAPRVISAYITLVQMSLIYLHNCKKKTKPNQTIVILSYQALEWFVMKQRSFNITYCPKSRQGRDLVKSRQQGNGSNSNSGPFFQSLGDSHQISIIKFQALTAGKLYRNLDVYRLYTLLFGNGKCSKSSTSLGQRLEEHLRSRKTVSAIGKGLEQSARPSRYLIIARDLQPGL